MYCTNCGNKINNNDKYCTKCGNKLDSENVQFNVNNNIEKKSYSGKKIASIVLGAVSIALSFMVIFAPLGLIISIIGLIFAFLVINKESNVLGILLNSVGLVISLGICIIFGFVFRYVVDDVKNEMEYYENSNDFNDNWGFGDFGERF